MSSISLSSKLYTRTTAVLVLPENMSQDNKAAVIIVSATIMLDQPAFADVRATSGLIRRARRAP
jgi:hypothetical protein